MALRRESLSKEEKSAASSSKEAEFLCALNVNLLHILGTGEPDGRIWWRRMSIGRTDGVLHVLSQQ